MSLPANMTTQAATRSTTWAYCAKIKASDGSIIGLTEHDETITVDLGDGDGAVEYTPADAVTLTAGRSAADLSVDNLDVIGAIDSARLTHEDLHRGRYDDGEITLFEVDWSNPGAGQKIHFAGPLGEVATDGQEFTVEVRSWTAVMSRVISRSISAQCTKSFGSLTAAQDRKPNLPCGVDLDPPDWAATTAYVATVDGDRLVGDRVKPTAHTGWWFRCTVAGTSGASEPTWPTTEGATVVDGTVTWQAERALAWAGTVTAVTDACRFTASGISVEAGFFARGHVEWLTGDNAGRGENAAVATDDGAGALALYKPVLKPIQVGDTFTIFAGCDKSQADCIAFSNWVNMNGFPHVPPRTV